MKFTKANVTEKLAECREYAGLTQHEFAAWSGFSRSLVALIETGRRPLAAHRVDAVIAILVAARAEREERLQHMQAIIDSSMPWTDEDREQLQRLRAKMEAALKCP